MKKDKTLLFTFDYELFLGKRSGNVLESVIKPTQDILNVLNEYNIKAIFFVDTTWLLKLKELSEIHPACKNKLHLISSQISNIIKEGHDVFPHLHPHWMDAVYNVEKDEFNLNNITHYRINQLTKEQREKLFDESIFLLKKIIHQEFPNYEINGFRAGGWSIQPFEDFKNSFEKHGIEYDFSVMPLTYQFSEAQHFDFSSCVNSSIYRFSDKIDEVNQNGAFIEIACDIIFIPPWINFINKIYLKFLYKVIGDSTHKKGIGVHAPLVNSKLKSPWGINLNNSNYERVSLDLLTRIKLPLYKKLIQSRDFVQFVSHPKLVTEHNILMLKYLLKFISIRYHLNSDFNYFLKTKLKLDKRPIILLNQSFDITTNGGSSNQKMPTLSVVIPCHNVASYIQEAIQSVLQQTVKCEEIICVDDCSTDNTVAIISELQKQYPSIIKLLQNEKNEGANFSRNKGLYAATSEFIQFFDADDLLLPTKFEHQLALIEKSKENVDIVVNSFKKRNLAGDDTLYNFESDDAWNSLMRGRLGVTTANLFRRSAIVNAGAWNENLKSSQEYDLMFRMLKNGAIITIDEAVLNINRERASGSITKSNPEAKWIRFINLRVAIYNYLHENNLMNDRIKTTFINEVFNSIRIIYYYNKMEAIDLHRKFILPIGKPNPNASLSKKYITIYNFMGFEIAQKIATILHPVKPY